MVIDMTDKYIQTKHQMFKRYSIEYLKSQNIPLVCAICKKKLNPKIYQNGYMPNKNIIENIELGTLQIVHYNCKCKSKGDSNGRN